jgi:hypothetical protein
MTRIFCDDAAHARPVLRFTFSLPRHETERLTSVVYKGVCRKCFFQLNVQINEPSIHSELAQTIGMNVTIEWLLSMTLDAKIPVSKAFGLYM